MSWWLGLGLVGGIVSLLLGAALERIWLALLGVFILVVTIFAELLFVGDMSDHQHALRDTRRAPCVVHASAHDASARVVVLLPVCADRRALRTQRDRRDA